MKYDLAISYLLRTMGHYVHHDRLGNVITPKCKLTWAGWFKKKMRER